MYIFFTTLFGSPIRRELNKIISNRIRNAEIAFRAEQKTLHEQKKQAEKALFEKLKDEHKSIKENHETRKQEVLTKRVNDILRTI